MHRSEELQLGLTDQGRIGRIRQKRYHPIDPWGQRRPRRQTAQGGYLRARRWALFLFLAHARDTACAAGSIQDLCGSGQFCPHGPVLQALPRGALFLCSSSAPVLETIRAGVRSVSPWQREPLLDENLAEVLATDIDTGEGASIAVLAMAHDLKRPGANEGG